MNILLKAEKIFDLVIIGRGINPDKSNIVVPLPKELDDRIVKNYSGLVTDFIKTLDYDNITLIKGIRNSNDLLYELNQYRYLQDLMPEIQLVSIFPDAGLEHISSSGIRSLSTFGKEHVEKYLL